MNREQLNKNQEAAKKWKVAKKQQSAQHTQL